MEIKMISNNSISFVMPAYNSEDTITESIESIFQSNFEDGDELIVVDGGSKDNTVKILSDLKIKYPALNIILSEEYISCPAARNIGIEKAQNPILFNLDSDNILVPLSIQQLKQFMIDEKAEVAAFGEIHFFQKNKDQITHKWIFLPGILTLADLLYGHINPASSGNYMFTKESWERVGKYWDYGPGLHEAWGFSLKQLANGSKFVIMPGTFYLHRYGHSSLYTRESQKEDESSLMATKMITSFIDLIDKEDAKYILSEEGRREWFKDLDKRPIRIKSCEIGRTGKVVDADGKLFKEKRSFKTSMKKAIRKILK